MQESLPHHPPKSFPSAYLTGKELDEIAFNPDGFLCSFKEQLFEHKVSLVFKGTDRATQGLLIFTIYHANCTTHPRGSEYTHTLWHSQYIYWSAQSKDKCRSLQAQSVILSILMVLCFEEKWQIMMGPWLTTLKQNWHLRCWFATSNWQLCGTIHRTSVLHSFQFMLGFLCLQSGFRKSKPHCPSLTFRIPATN